VADNVSEAVFGRSRGRSLLIFDVNADVSSDIPDAEDVLVVYSF
jgi:hypothetical protein